MSGSIINYDMSVLFRCRCAIYASKYDPIGEGATSWLLNRGIEYIGSWTVLYMQIEVINSQTA